MDKYTTHSHNSASKTAENPKKTKNNKSEDFIIECHLIFTSTGIKLLNAVSKHGDKKRNNKKSKESLKLTILSD